MHLHLLVPDLLSPGADIRIDAGETLLARGRHQSAPSHSTESWLCEQYGLEDAAAGSAFCLLGDGRQPADACWLRADPVHLRIDRDELVLADSTAFAITDAEARALTDSFNAHFAPALQLDPVHPERWYAQLDSAPETHWTPLAEARGKPISRHLPKGDAAMRWHALMNEAQMLLHEHPVNEAREARGELPLNSIWFWGGGKRADLPGRPFERVFANDPLARGLAAASGAAAAPLPASATDWLRTAPESGNVLLLLDALRAPFAYGELSEWATRVAALERDWLLPLLAALRDGRIGMLTTHCLSADGSIAVETTRMDLRRFWRRRKPLASYVMATV